MQPVPERIFAPSLQSQRLTYTLLDVKNQDHLQFIADGFNHDAPGNGPTNGAWTTQDIRRTCYLGMMYPSDANGRRTKDPCTYLFYLATDPDKPIGSVNLHRRSSELPMDLGYFTVPDQRQKGYGAEAVDRVMKYWTDEWGLKEMCIITGESNVASKKLAERVGFVDGGHVTIMNGQRKLPVYVLPGMKKLEGPKFPAGGNGEVPDEDW